MPAPSWPNPEIPQSQSHCIAGCSFPHLLRQEPLRNCLPFQCPPSMLRPQDPPWPLLMAGLPSTRPFYLRSVPPSIEPLESDRPSPSPTTSLTTPPCCHPPHSLHSHILECSCSSQPCRKHMQDTACQIGAWNSSHRKCEGAVPHPLPARWLLPLTWVRDGSACPVFPAWLAQPWYLSQCPEGCLPTRLFTNIPRLPRPALVAHGYRTD